MNLCASGESKERDGGSYNCSDGSWFVKNSKCCECCPVPLQRAESTRAPSMPTLCCELVRMAGLCAGPRAERAEGKCGDRKPCVALIVDEPT